MLHAIIARACTQRPLTHAFAYDSLLWSRQKVPPATLFCIGRGFLYYKYILRLYEDDIKFFGPGVAALLERIPDAGSLRAAAASMNMAYSKAWKIMHRAEEMLGFPLLESHIGGAGGGGAAVTERAQIFLACYREFETRLHQTADRLFAEIFENKERMNEEL